MRIAVVSLILVVVCSSCGPPQEYTRWGLPEGAKMRLGKGRITEIEFSPNGDLLAAASTNGVWLYDTSTLRESSFIPVNSGRVTSMAFSPDGEILAVGNGRGIHLWNVNSGENLGTFARHSLGSIAWYAVRMAERLRVRAETT